MNILNTRCNYRIYPKILVKLEIIDYGLFQFIITSCINSCILNTLTVYMNG